MFIKWRSLSCSGCPILSILTNSGCYEKSVELWVLCCRCLPFLWSVLMIVGCVARSWRRTLVSSDLCGDLLNRLEVVRRSNRCIQIILGCKLAQVVKWPWTTPNRVFKVTPLFDAKYLTNGYRYGPSYYRRQNRKPHPSFRMAPVSMTLSNL